MRRAKRLFDVVDGSIFQRHVPLIEECERKGITVVFLSDFNDGMPMLSRGVNYDTTFVLIVSFSFLFYILFSLVYSVHVSGSLFTHPLYCMCASRMTVLRFESLPSWKRDRAKYQLLLSIFGSHSKPSSLDYVYDKYIKFIKDSEGCPIVFTDLFGKQWRVVFVHLFSRSDMMALPTVCMALGFLYLPLVPELHAFCVEIPRGVAGLVCRLSALPHAWQVQRQETLLRFLGRTTTEEDLC
jgi:hypothetical protein